MNLELLQSEIRTKLGGPSSSELSGTVIEYAIQDALDELGRLQPYYTYEEVDILKSIDTYSVGSDIIDVKGFWFSYSNTYTDFDYKEKFALAGDGIPLNEYADLKVFHSPSLMNILEEKWERVQSRNKHSWEFNPDSQEILIIPQPLHMGKGVYKGLLKRDLDNIPEKYLSPFKDLAQACTMDSWIFSISMIKSIPIGVGKVDYETKGMEKARDTLRERAIRKLSSGGSAVVIG